MATPTLTIRRADTGDVPRALAVATAALGWDPDEPNEALFRWKHLDNPAGESPMWVAVDGDEVVGFRTMLRWRFAGAHGSSIDAVRAVDTATDPAHQRRGIFRSLTTAALEALHDEGVGFVFNTPNDRSRPGYLGMGWRDEGRLAVRVRVSSPRSLPGMVRARVPAARWSEPVSFGDPIETLADDLSDLLRRLPPTDGLATDRTVDHLRWRYGFEPLRYRVVRTDGGAAIVRVRRRGPTREAVLAEVLSPDRRTTRELIARVVRDAGVDHVLTLDRAPHPASWLPSVPGLGPRLTVRDLRETAPHRRDLRFALGDIELF